MNANTILKRAKEQIMKRIYEGKEDTTIAGGASIQLLIRPAKGSDWSNSKEENGALSILSLTKEDYGISTGFYTSANTSPRLHDGDDYKWIYLYPTMIMMRTWTDRCLGEDCSYQVALTKEQYITISKEYMENYGRVPEQTGVSPWAGSIVIELECSYFRIQLDITCLTELEPKENLRIASDAIKQMSDDIKETLSGYSLEQSGIYPNIDQIL